jgi:hypothetical protein
VSWRVDAVERNLGRAGLRFIDNRADITVVMILVKVFA